jgi:lipopolysaccharide transport system ATP-binding protein
MSVAIRAEGLSKSYRLGVGGNAHPTLRETISGLSRRLLHTRPDGPPEKAREFWALKDVSFEVPTGEVLGIIGPNGAGKTTLLKILAQITQATRGRVEIDGRIGALLEVGAGFHQELTGRENIFLNGAVLGMTRAETAEKLDAIVDFAGVEPFLDTPVKRYSSGMYLRLAFAVAAHIDPDILIVDEVLAVGDADFQRKCMAKTESIAETGRTVLFISHQMSMVQQLCTRCILIQNGRLVDDGPTGEVIPRYLAGVESVAAEGLAARTQRSGRGRVRIADLRIESPGGAPAAGAPARIVFKLAGESVPVDCSFTIYDELGVAVSACDSAERSDQDRIGGEFACDFEALLLRPGRYRINTALNARGGSCEDHVEGALVFDVRPGLLDGREVAVHRGYGSIALPHRWTRTDP